MTVSQAEANVRIRLFDDVCNLCRRTGFALNKRQLNVLRAWIADGESDVDQMADAVVCC